MPASTGGLSVASAVLFASRPTASLLTLDPRCYGNDSLYSQAAAQRYFDNARAELGLNPVPLPRQWNTQFNYAPSTCMLIETPAKCFEYHTIFKCGNNAIRGSLEHYTSNLSEAYSNFTAFATRCGVVEREADAHCHGKPVVSFTFVREPLSHFLSGYGEYMYRRYVRAAHRSSSNISAYDIRRLVRESDQPLQFVRELVSGPQWPFHEVTHGVISKHMSLMSGSIKPNRTRLNYVGRLSNVNKDWHDLFSLGNITGTPLEAVRLEEKWGTHESSLDPIRVRAEMRDVLRSNPDIRRGLCRLLERDYLCFSYDFRACLDGTAIGAIPTSTRADAAESRNS